LINGLSILLLDLAAKQQRKMRRMRSFGKWKNLNDDEKLYGIVARVSCNKLSRMKQEA
jgi:hypothetical protein